MSDLQTIEIDKSFIYTDKASVYVSMRGEYSIPDEVDPLTINVVDKQAGSLPFALLKNRTVTVIYKKKSITGDIVALDDKLITLDVGNGTTTTTKYSSIVGAMKTVSVLVESKERCTLSYMSPLLSWSPSVVLNYGKKTLEVMATITSRYNRPLHIENAFISMASLNSRRPSPQYARSAMSPMALAAAPRQASSEDESDLIEMTYTIQDVEVKDSLRLHLSRSDLDVHSVHVVRGDGSQSKRGTFSLLFTAPGYIPPSLISVLYESNVFTSPIRSYIKGNHALIALFSSPYIKVDSRLKSKDRAFNTSTKTDTVTIVYENEITSNASEKSSLPIGVTVANSQQHLSISFKPEGKVVIGDEYTISMYKHNFSSSPLKVTVTVARLYDRYTDSED